MNKMAEFYIFKFYNDKLWNIVELVIFIDKSCSSYVAIA